MVADIVNLPQPFLDYSLSRPRYMAAMAVADTWILLPLVVDHELST